MITKEQWQSLMDAGKIQEQAEGHMNEVIRAVAKVYGKKVDWWAYPGADEGGMGEMRVYGDHISVDVSLSGYVDLDCEHGNLCSNFPIEYLFKPVEDIVEEVKEYKAEVEEAERKKKAKQKQQREARKKKKAKLKQSAASKLTAEERKALGL